MFALMTATATATQIPLGFEDMVAPMRAAHEAILARLAQHGLTFDDYPIFTAPGNPRGIAAAKAHPMQGILKYHGLTDWAWRTAYLPSISVTNDVAQSLTIVEFDPDLKEDAATIGGLPATPRELERVTQSLNAVRQIARINSRARVTSKNIVEGGKTGKGLGTSASGSAALATAAIAAAYGPEIVRNTRFISTLSRLLAGSGCRVASGGVSLWLSYPGIAHEESFAIRLDNKQQLNEMRLITVPIDSRIGLKTELAHVEAPKSPLFKNWMRQRGGEILQVMDAVQRGDWLTVAQFAEYDSIHLHAVTMTGGVEHKLFAWEPENITLFRLCDDLRAQNIPVYFSTDTGPTMVLLTHAKHVDAIVQQIHHAGFDAIPGGIGDGAMLVDVEKARALLGN